MKKNYILFLLLLFFQYSFSQADFTKLFISPEGNYTNIIETDFCQMEDSGFVIIGRTDDPQNRQFIARTDKSGLLQHHFEIKNASSGFFALGRVLALRDTSYIVVGTKTDFANIPGHVFCAKYNRSDSLIWCFYYQCNAFAVPSIASVMLASNNIVTILVNDNLYDTAGSSVQILQLAQNGDIIAQRKFNTLGLSYLLATGITEIGTNRFAISGFSEDAQAGFILKLYSMDSVEWFKIYAGTGDMDINFFDNKYYLSCYIRDSINFVKMDSNGVIEKRIYYPATLRLNCKILKMQNSFLLYQEAQISVYFSTVHGIFIVDTAGLPVATFVSFYKVVDMSVGKNNKILTITSGPVEGVRTSYHFSKQFSLSDSWCRWVTTNPSVMNLSVDSSENRTVTLDTLGHKFAYNLQMAAINIVQENNCPHTKSGIFASSAIDHQFTLYPNPSNGQIQLDNAAEYIPDATIIIYDQVGKELLKFQQDLSEQTQLDISNLSSGSYFYQIISKNAILKNDKFVLIK